MHKKLIVTLAICISSLFVLPNQGTAASRTALVIGNSNYPSAPLQNPVNDARDMAEILKGFGFEVLCKVNAGREQMDAAVQDFYRNLNRARVGLFYYAGHGMQIDGTNYLLPVDIQVASSADVKHRAIKMDWILAKMEDSGSKVNIVVLDACRDNPFRGLRGAGDGLAPIQSVRGSFVAYSTSPGSVARDGTGRNGIYTTHLLRNIKRPGLTVEEVFREVRKGVAEDTHFEQIPWDSSSLMGAFYIGGTGVGDTEKKQQEIESQPIDISSPPQAPSQSGAPLPTANEIGRDGQYVAYANGIVWDTKTGLEWKAGPDKVTEWDEAYLWVQNLNVGGGKWRMPTLKELETLYKEGAGSRNMTPLLKTKGWNVWSFETNDSGPQSFFFWKKPANVRPSELSLHYLDKRAFAVRSRSDGAKQRDNHLNGSIETKVHYSNIIMTKNWYIQKENLKLIDGKIECIEDGFRLIQVYDEKTHKIGKWKFYAKLKVHRSLFGTTNTGGLSLSGDYPFCYALRDKDNDIIAYAEKDLFFTLGLLCSINETKPVQFPDVMEVRGEGEIRAEDVERVRSRSVQIWR
jgi:hypothetical protein